MIYSSLAHIKKVSEAMKYEEKEVERVDVCKKCHIIKVNDLRTEIVD